MPKHKIKVNQRASINALQISQNRQILTESATRSDETLSYTLTHSGKHIGKIRIHNHHSVITTTNIFHLRNSLLYSDV